MRLRIDRMLFNNDVTKLRNDAQNLQRQKMTRIKCIQWLSRNKDTQLLHFRKLLPIKS